MKFNKSWSPIEDKSCMIDVISKEAVIRNRAKLQKAEVETIPYATTYYNTTTGEYVGHAEMIYFYNDDTWHYSSTTGSTRIYKDKLSEDILTITNKIYKLHFPHYRVQKVVPMDIITFFPDDNSQPLPDHYINKDA
jgi:hypothetical protein